MEGRLWLEILILAILILLNGICSLAEIAIVGARKTKLVEMAEKGDKGAKAALKAAENTEEMFSTIQISITAIGIFTGMFSGASLSTPLARELSKIPLLSTHAEWLSIAIVIACVTYVMLIVGELVPKWIGFAIPEKASCYLAKPMMKLSLLCKPLIIFCNFTTQLIVKSLGINMEEERPVSEEEIKVLLRQGAKLGTFDKEEPKLVDRIFELNDRTVADCMTSRVQLIWIDLEEEVDEVWRTIKTTSHFRMPVGNGSLDEFKGLVDISRVLLKHQENMDRPIKATIMKSIYEPLYIPETLTLTKALQIFKTKGVHEAIVIDEYGTLSGLVTLHDILEQIVGDMPGDENDILEEKNKFVKETDTTWIIDGLCSIDEFREFFKIENELPHEEDAYYKTVGGFVTYLFGYIPDTNDETTFKNLTFKVISQDNHRIEKVKMTIKEIPKEKTDDKQQ